MKNLIFLCVFHNEGYLKLLNLLLESLYLYGNLHDDTEILIYTSSVFSEIIQKNTLFADKISYHINDEYDSVKSACRARYDFFSIPDISDYLNILYLDVDVLIKKDINPLFENIIEREKVYVLEEGDISQNCDYWGNVLFSQEEIDKTEDKSAFTSGIILFRNCEVINTLFEKIKKDMIDRDQHFSTVDQPYFVYNAMKYKLYDNKKLKAHILDFRSVKQIEKIADSDKTIVHYCNEIGLHQEKHRDMLQTLTELKQNKNLVYMCVFNDGDFKFVFTALNDLLLKGDLNFSTHILIYTTESFCKEIKNGLQKSTHFPLNHKNYINFVCKIHFHTTADRGTQVDIFDLPIARNYKKMLYLNYNVNKPVMPLFDLIKRDQVYMLSSADKISTDIMLFKYSEKIKKIFEIIKLDITIRKLSDNDNNYQNCIIDNLKKFRLMDYKQIGNFVHGYVAETN